MKKLLWICTFFVSNFCFSQRNFLKEVELAENHFALESQIIGLKAGFLKNMDTSAVGLNAKGFSSLYSTWKNRPEGKGILLWEPKTVFSSEDGLWGITNGPWYTRDSTGKLINPGYFFTIWKRNTISEPYTFLLDMGIQLDSVVSVEKAVSIPHYSSSVRPGNKTHIDKGSASDFNFTSSTISLLAALEKYTGQEAAVLISGKGRVLKNEFSKILLFNQTFHFSRTKTISLSRTSALFEYGTLSFKNGSGELKSGYYVHVWSYTGNKTRLITAFYKWD